MGESTGKPRDSRSGSGLKIEIERLQEVLASICLQAVEVRTAINRLEDIVEGDTQQSRQESQQQRRRRQSASPPSGAQELKSGCKVKILPRRNEMWRTGQFVGQIATIKDVTPKCVWLIVEGREEPLRRNKEFVKLIE
jgi:hypothetical protein